MSLPRIAALVAAGSLTAAALAAPLASSTAAPSSSTNRAATATPTLPTSGLDILLTNDDGWNALGITAMYAKLTAAGHRVTLSAPLTNQSGVSAKVTLGSSGVGVVNQAENKWSVEDSPVTSMIFGIRHLYKDKPLPDLVISGTNVGPNVGFDTNFSGTVGAAITAAGLFDIPAIAVSTDLSKDVFPPDETTGSYDETSDLIVSMIARGIPDLPKGEVINVNYPDLNATLAKPRGIKYVSNSQNSLLTFNFIQRPDNPAKFAISPGAGPAAGASPANSDIRELAAGYVTVGVLRADRSVPASEAPSVAKLVRQLNGEPEPKPPVVTPPKVSVQKLPKRVLNRTSQWLRATGTPGTAVRISCNPKKGRTVVQRTTINGGLVSLKAPTKAGTYRVTVTSGTTKLQSGKVLVR